ncbi:MAG: TldD/PmbA family protein [Gemmatimonadaceae bacterium]|nr:TldD/PmbA family protein [Gemmatimonadaceae bacterium]
MSPSRRDFLRSTSAAAMAVGLGNRGIEMNFIPPFLSHTARPVPDNVDIRQLAAAAMDAARGSGAQYADVRFAVMNYQVLSVSDRLTSPMRAAEVFSYGIRVLVDGTWGFSGRGDVTPDGVATSARLAVAQARSHLTSRRQKVELVPSPAVVDGNWKMPIRVDPFTVPVTEQIDLMLAANEAALRIKGVSGVRCTFEFLRDDRTFASTDGSFCRQLLYFAFPFVGSAEATARSSTDRSLFTSRYVDIGASGQGYEIVLDANLPESLPRAAEEAVAMQSARSVDVGRHDLVLHPMAIAAPLANSLGRALELDRALGYEANAGGTTFLAPASAILGKMRVGSPLLTLTGDRSAPKSAAAVGWDDEGVPPVPFTLIDEGLVVDYQTTRELAANLDWWYKQRGTITRSNGCATAPVADQIPLVHNPNLLMKPSANSASFDDIIADTKRGFAIQGRTSGSIDQQQLNGQYSGGVVREIRDGKLAGYVKDFAFQFRTPEFWKSLDAIGGRESMMLCPNSASKGQPRQLALQSIGAVPVRMRQVNVINTGRRG